MTSKAAFDSSMHTVEEEKVEVTGARGGIPSLWTPPMAQE